MTEIPDHEFDSDATDDSTFLAKVTNITRKMSLPVGVLAVIGACVILAITLITASDVVGRYVFKKPVEGANEIVALLYVCVSACGLAYCQLKNSHLRVDVVIDRIKPRLKEALTAFANVLGLAVTSIIAWQLLDAARRFFFNLQGGSKSSELLGIPWYPFMILFGIGFALFAFILLLHAISSTFKAVKG